MEIINDQSIEKAYGCLYVKSGDETRVVRIIEKNFPNVIAYAIMQTKHKSVKGKRSYSSELMLPGYVLFHTNSEMPASQLLAITSVYRILKYGNNKWNLQDDDLSFAKWVVSNNGEIGVSEIYLEGETIHITKGPLKTLEGKILRVDKRNRNALVSLGFDCQNFKAWLAFEWMIKTEQAL